ncbi:MAG: hypothetical protein IH789_12850 [Acidobacteria bacterium]|nr:hypothetical protein [Acidobacteriota bacterium]
MDAFWTDNNSLERTPLDGGLMFEAGQRRRSARSRYPAATAWGQPETALVVNFFNRISEEQVVLSLSGEECQRPTSN